MKKIDANELYQNLSGFLRSQGVELKDGTATDRIRKGCHALTDVINTTQDAVDRARGSMDRNLDRFRQTIHEATAPKAAGTPPPRSASSRTGRASRPTARAAKATPNASSGSRRKQGR